METTIILPTGGILYLSGILFAFEAVKILNISLNLYKRGKTGGKREKCAKMARMS